MKMDMMGSGAVFAAMTALQDLGVQTAVTGWMMCTDNMPSGSATKLGDVLTMRNGKTVEVRNTDAEGRLVLGDGLALATEETPRPDALVDIATLTGAAMAALGTHSSAMFANNDAVATQLQAAADRTAEDVWRMPLDHRLRKDLKSNVADFSNIGGPFGGAIVAAIYLNEFVDGIPWGHLDIAGTMESESDDLWRSAGSTGVGARLLAEFASAFEKPSGEVDTGNDE
jgi:leucyl aminopeptidase